GISFNKLNGIELESFSWGVSNSGTPASETGAGAGKASFSDFSFTAPLGEQSPQLMTKCVEGEVLQTATLTIVGAPSQIMIKFAEVLVSSYKLDEHSLQKVQDEFNARTFFSERPKESVTLNFAKIEFNFGGTIGTGGVTSKSFS
ncbi:MAG: type VI secretion system tube protein Hcp, partial [Terriglobales bacterium]